MKKHLITVLMLASAASCVGGFDEGDGPISVNPQPPNPNDGEAKRLFDSTVKSFVIADCASCHRGDANATVNAFLGPTPETTAYPSVVRDRNLVGDWVVARAEILTKGIHGGLSKWWTPDQSAKITAWLTKEATERNVSQMPTDPPPNTNEPATTSMKAMQKFAGCMAASQAEWEQTQAYTIANMGSNNGNCSSCHNGGAGGSFMNRDRQLMLERNQEQTFFNGMFSTSQVPGTPVTWKVEFNTTKFCAKAEERANRTGTHPGFNCNGGGATAMKNFVTAINNKLTAGACGTPGFRAPPATP